MISTRLLLSAEEKPCNDVAERIVGMLTVVAMQEIESKLGIKVDVLRTLLLDAEKEAIQLLGASDLLEKLEDAFYDAHDLLDSLRAESSEQSMARKQVGLTFCSTYRLKRLVSKIKGIEKELVERRAREFRSHYLSKESPKDSKVVSKASKDFIGRDKDAMEKLMSILKADEEVVIPIVDEGFGETELVKVVFNDEHVQKNFKMRLWLTGFDSLKIDYHLRYSLFPEKVEGKKFLLVVEDVCKEDIPKFTFLRDLSRCGAEGSRLIVITRSEKVMKCIKAATKTRSLDPPDEEHARESHHSESLDEDAKKIHQENSLDGDYKKEACHLGSPDEKAPLTPFQSVSFQEGEEPKNLNEIVEKWRRNPLAIRTRANMNYLESLGTERQSFNPQDISKMPQEKVDALRMLKSSYKLLPPHLKPCFVYCGLFPKNHKIDVQKLVRVWMSQGFIMSNRPEDVGYEYFSELLGRCFFDEAEEDEWGNIRKCKMPSIMHDLAREVAGIECVTLGLEGEDEIHSKTRHVSFDFHLDSPWQISDFLFRAKKIRTIILPSQLHWQIEGRSGTSICDTIVSNFKHLRTLDLHNSGLKIVSRYIGKLKHLRYLDLSRNTDIKFLPNSISRLHHLETLKLNFCGRLEELPRNLKKLVNLRNLELDSCYSLTHMPRGIGQLTNLQTLSEFVLRNDDSNVSRAQLEELQGLINLKGELRIKNLRFGIESREAKLNEKEHLQSLVLIWDTEAEAQVSNEEMPLEGLKPHSNLKELSMFAYSRINFPDWISSQENLVKFSLWKCMKCKHLPPLNHLPSLKVLALEDMSDLEHISEPASLQPFFPSLKELRLVNLPKLRSWWTKDVENLEEAARFPCLSELVIEDCPNLTSMPHSEVNLLVLKSTIWSPFSFAKSLSQLKTLRIVCTLISNEDEHWKCLQSLQSLTLDHLPYIKTLPKGLQNLTGLQELQIWRCNSLKDISESVDSLTSLRRLSLKLCLNLELSLQTVSKLASFLKDLEIENCPHVKNVLNQRISS